MNMKLFKDPFLFDSLKTEISVMKKLHSENVVKMYEVIQEKDMTYIILEYCPDGDLSHFIRKVFILYLFPFKFSLTEWWPFERKISS